MAFGANDMEATGFQHLVVSLLPVRPDSFLVRAFAPFQEFGFEVAAKHDIGAATSHVRRNRNCAGTPGLLHDVGFTFVLLRIQHLVLDAVLLQHRRQQLRRFDRGRANQRRLTTFAAIGNVLDDRVELVRLRQIDQVGHIVADHRFVRRNHDDFEAVNLLELKGFGVCRTSHAGQVVIQAEIILKSNGRDCLVFLLDCDAFFRFHGLVQSIRPAPPRHRPAGEFINNHDLAIGDDVLDILLEHDVRT